MNRDDEQLHPLRRWRKEKGLSVRQAAALIVVDGKPSDGATWFGWENGKIPKPDWMRELERVTALEPNDFYRRPDAGVLPVPANEQDPPQLAMF